MRTERDREYAWRMSRGGMSHKEIADMLGYPITTVRNWISLGNRFTREAMDRLNKGRQA